MRTMMTSSNGNIFRITGPLCEFIGYRWIPLTKASDAELLCFLWSVPWINGWVNNREAGDLRRHRVHYDVISMTLGLYDTLVSSWSWHTVYRADSRFVPSQWETALLRNDVSNWLGASLESHDDVIKWKHFSRYWPLCGDCTGHRWIPLTKATDAELLCFLWSAPWINGWVNNREAGESRRHRAHHDVILMTLGLWDTLVSSWSWHTVYRADSRFAPSQWETALLCNDVSNWLGASLESALCIYKIQCR